MDRRAFLTTAAAAGAAALSGCTRVPPPLPTGDLLGTALDLGHRLSAGSLPPPSETRKVPVVIVGAGIAGLAAGWKLAHAGFADFLLLELENDVGGNSRAGHNAVSAYPWGAHYLPLPTREATAVRELLAEIGVLQGDPRAQRPVYDERYLCATPQERLYRDGRWQEGLLPQHRVGTVERAQYQQFAELIDAFRHRRDAGSPAFALPMARSSRAGDLQALDRLSMRDWLLAQGLDSPHLHWYVNYACRDDYGSGSACVSAWAGIHYFACRDGEAQNASSETVLTAPEGNAWLARGMLRAIRARAGERVLTGALVFRVANCERASGSRAFAVDLWLPDEQRTLRLRAEQLIWAAPLFLVPHVFVAHEALKTAARSYSHAPWLTANLTLSRLPDERGGASLAWDNVLYQGAGLGYVVATHQQLRLAQRATVFTYYRPLDEFTPSQGRAVLRDTPRAVWAEQILAELERPHANLRQLVTRLDVFRNGHAMCRPLPGLIFGAARQRFAADGERLRFAHADVSGFSLFEEAHYRGVLAAERTLQRLGVRFVSSLA